MSEREIEIVIAVALALMPASEKPKPPDPVPVALCRCGPDCPLGGCTDCQCPDRRPGRPEGEGWQWDAEKKFWWKYTSAASATPTQAAPVLAPVSAPAYSTPATFRPVPVFTPTAPTLFRPAATPRAAAANCST